MTDFENLSQWLEQTATQCSERVALAFESGALSYQQLNLAANQLAQQLSSEYDELLVKSPLIGICISEGPALVISILACWKISCAYVPLEPEYPNNHLKKIITDSQTALVITEESLASKFDCATKILKSTDNNIDPECTTKELPSYHNPLAYIFYTSGSTGTPKGVMISHKSLAARLRHTIDGYGLDKQDVFLHHLSYSFDISVDNMLSPLLLGAKLILPPNRARYHPAILLECLQQHNVSVFYFIPSAMHILLDFMQTIEAKHSTTRLFLSGGEKLTLTLMKRMQKVFNADIYNTYGPTENTITSLIYKCPIDLQQDPPIGACLPETNCYIVDKNNKQVKQGECGELLLGGIGLADGYLNNADLTNEKFVSGLLHKSERLYYTGDLAKINKQGFVEFIGRVDTQVKIHGHRIELGSIESHLSNHPAVELCAVLANELEQQTTLIAFVKLHLEETIDANELRNYLATSLPNYMLPGRFVFLDNLPLTSSQKLDRKALLKSIETNTTEATPQSDDPIQVIIHLWQQWFTHVNVDQDTPFFYAGGDSLTAMKLFIELEKRYKVRLPFETIYQYNTPKQLAEQLKSYKAQLSPTLINTRPYQQTFPLTNSQQIFWLMQKESEVVLRNIIGTLHFSGPINIKFLQHALSNMVKEQSILWAQFSTAQLIQKFIPPNKELLPLELKKHSQLNSAKEYNHWLRQQLMIRAERKFNYKKMPLPLIEFELYIHCDDEHTLFITMPHIVCDLYSLEIMYNRIKQHYLALNEGKELKLCEPKLTFPQFIVWEKYILEENLPSHLDFWDDYLEGVRLLQIDKHCLVKKINTSERDAPRLILSESDLQKLHQFCTENNTSTATGLIAIITFAISQKTQQQDLLILTINDSRDLPHMDELVGPLLRSSLIRINCPDDKSLVSVLENTRKAISKTRPHLISTDFINIGCLTKKLFPGFINRFYFRCAKALSYPAAYILSRNQLPRLSIEMLLCLVAPSRIWIKIRDVFITMFSPGKSIPDPSGLSLVFNINNDIYTPGGAQQQWEELRVTSDHAKDDRFTKIQTSKAQLFTSFRDADNRINISTDGPLTDEFSRAVFDEIKKQLNTLTTSEN